MILKPEQIIIPDEKILNYLLLSKEKNDKSGFLSRLGFNKNNYTELIEEIRKLLQQMKQYCPGQVNLGICTGLKENLKVVSL